MLLGFKFLGGEERGFERAIHTSHWLLSLPCCSTTGTTHVSSAMVTIASHTLKELHWFSGIASKLLLFVRDFVHVRTIYD